MTRTLVIAEPGCTAQGDYDTMVRLIDAAAEAGADVFKAQWMSDPDLVCARRHAPEFRAAYEWLRFPIAWHEHFRNRCRGYGLQYACSSYVPKDVWLVDPFVTLHKIAACEASDEALRMTAVATGKRLLISTGMLDARAVEWMYGPCSLLACTAAYPAPIEDLQLAMLRTRRYVGLSDHSRDVRTGAVAVGAGATIIEAHLRLPDCDPQNPDYATAFTPEDFMTYVSNIRFAELAMGDGLKAIQPSEAAMLPYRVTGVSPQQDAVSESPDHRDVAIRA